MLLELELEVVEEELVVVVEVVVEALVLVDEPDVMVVEEVEALALAVPWKVNCTL